MCASPWVHRTDGKNPNACYDFCTWDHLSIPICQRCAKSCHS